MSALPFGRTHERSPRVPEFQAVVLAGFGSNLQPLTNELARGNASSPTPKALLPIVNRPMIFYPLAWLQDAHVSDVLIVMPHSHKSDISHTIWHSDENYPSLSSLSMTIETIDDSEAMSLGTADILRKFSHLFVTDMIVLACDFIPPPSLSLTSILNDYRVELDQPLVSVLLYERSETGKDGPPPCIFGEDKKSNSLIFVENDDAEDDLDLRMSMLWRFPNISLTTRYLDSHVYILKHKCIELLCQRPSLQSLKDDVIPWLAGFSYRQSYVKKWGLSMKFGNDPQELAISHSTTPFSLNSNKRASHFSPSDNAISRSAVGIDSSSSSASSFSTTEISHGRPEAATRSPASGGSKTGASPLDGHDHSSPVSAPLDESIMSHFRVSVRFHDLKDGYAARANTISAYVELNRQILVASTSVAASGQLKSPAVSTQPHQGQISSDSVVASSARIGEKASVKKSIVGPHCIIGKNVRLSGCTLMGYVEVKDGAKLENCIVSRNVVVAERATLKDCELAPGVQTQPDGKSSIVKYAKPSPLAIQAVKPTAQTTAPTRNTGVPEIEVSSSTQFGRDVAPESPLDSAEPPPHPPGAFLPSYVHRPPLYHVDSINLLTIFAFVLALIVSLKGERISTW